jgi:hypothetical protein
VGAAMEFRDIANVQILRGPAGNAVRTQHHRRCGSPHHQRTGNRRRQFRSRGIRRR